MTSTTTPPPAREVLRDLAATWNAGDATAYADLFTDEATYVTFDGRLLHGRAAIDHVHRGLFAGPLRDSLLAMEVRDETPPPVSVVGDDLIVLVTDGGVSFRGAAPRDRGRDSVQTLVLVRDAERWRVAAFQNTRKQGRG